MSNLLKGAYRFLFITKNAWEKIESILSSNKNTIAMKFSAEGGGCNGYNYKFNPIDINEYNSFNQEKIKPTIIQNGNSKILIEPLSEMLLLGTTIDYIKENYEKQLYESKFVFTPNKKLASTCGCGVSFNFKNIN